MADTGEVIRGADETEVSEAFEAELEASYDGMIQGLLCDIFQSCENLEHNDPAAYRHVRTLAVFVENIELRLRGER